MIYIELTIYIEHANFERSSTTTILTIVLGVVVGQDSFFESKIPDLPSAPIICPFEQIAFHSFDLIGRNQKEKQHIQINDMI